VALKLRLDLQAKQDLTEIRGYLLEQAGIASANRVRDHLRKRFMRLLKKPMLGVETAEPGILYLAPIRYPYRIYYTVTAVAVVILHIRHSARLDPDLSKLRHLHEDAAVYGVPSAATRMAARPA
jgi:plasmid stabilization system protein ParE